MNNIVTKKGVEHKHQEPYFIVAGGSISSPRERSSAVTKCGYWVDMYYREPRTRCLKCFKEGG